MPPFGRVIRSTTAQSRTRSPSARASARGGRRAFTFIELLSSMAVIGLLAALAVPRISSNIERARVAKAIGDIRAVSIDLMGMEVLPANLAAIGRGSLLDPWGRPYQYYKFPANRRNPPGARKDRFLVPINSAFDLYSLGKDGRSAPPLTAADSRDDVIMGNDGGYYGLASKY